MTIMDLFDFYLSVSLPLRTDMHLCFNSFTLAVNELLFSVPVVNVHVHCQFTYVKLNACNGNKLIFCTHAF